MTSVDALADELESRVYMQRLEEPFTRNEYKALIVNAIKRLYVDTGRALIYNNDMFTTNPDPDSTDEDDSSDDTEPVDPAPAPADDDTPAEEDDEEPISPALYFTADLLIDEEEYVLLIAEQAFLKIIQKDVNTMVSYTTDALSVQHGDKPYANLADSIEKRENLRRELLYRMIRYMKGVSY